MRKELMYPVSVLLVTVTTTCLFAQLPAGWTSAGLGNPTAPGSAQHDRMTETWTIRGDGTGIRGTADQFHYVYKKLSGDGELVARVVSLDPPLADWSMAGVMIRVLLIPGSPYIFMGISANTDGLNHGITLWGRAAINGLAEHESTGSVTGPYWVKVKRTGDTVAGYSSPDGKEWTERYSTAAPGIPKDVYIGYAVTSEVAGKLVTAVFDKGPTKASEPDPKDGATNVITPLLRWTPGVTAASHKVYFGTNPAPGPDQFMAQVPLTPPAYVPVPVLAPGTTYYWRIDEVAADGTTVYLGDVWRFTSAPATAFAPDPWDGLNGVGVEQDLAWSPGLGALSHDLYLGTDKAAVKAGDPNAFKGHLQIMRYDPGTLAENTTYYWRVDEHDGAGVVLPGTLWSFTTVGPGLGVRAQYFRDRDVAGVPLLTRAEDSINHGWGDGEVAAGLSDGISARWTANLEAPFTETYQLITTTDDGVRLWLDGRRIIDNWTNHGTTDDVAQVELVAGQFYLVQMNWYENTGGAVAMLSWQSPSLSRQVIPSGPLQLPLRATSPYPANTSANAPQELLLYWSPGAGATDHDIYFGADADAVADADTASAETYQGRQDSETTAFDPGQLEWKKTYYWRVDEVNATDPESPWTGAVWSFTTADFLVVDDFESYADESRFLYETWLDGWTNNNGSTVGYWDPPYAEQKVVHSGRQSMPIEYNNVSLPWYSEAERTWSVMQDWTAGGVETLVLYVRGLASNAPTRLYVAVEDKAGHKATVAHPDSSPVTATQWTEWRIPLADLRAANASLNLTLVEILRIGVGNREQPVPGGQGKIFIDDIRVVKP